MHISSVWWSFLQACPNNNYIISGGYVEQVYLMFANANSLAGINNSSDYTLQMFNISSSFLSYHCLLYPSTSWCRPKQTQDCSGFQCFLCNNQSSYLILVSTCIPVISKMQLYLHELLFTYHTILIGMQLLQSIHDHCRFSYGMKPITIP